MPRLGVITCQVLELEFVHLLANDPGVERISVIEDEFSAELIDRLSTGTQKTVQRISRADTFRPHENKGFSVLVQVMKVGLHSNIPLLKEEVKTAVSQMAPFVDAVLLGYGLCGNALVDAGDLFKEVPVPVSLPMEKDEPVDDCVGLIIGGRENYYQEQCLCAGTMFMNAGFSRHWEKILAFEVPEKLKDKTEKIVKIMMGSYKRCLLLPTPVLGQADLRKNTAKFSEKHGLDTQTRPGTLDLLDAAWEQAKQNAASAAGTGDKAT